jgi:hypothetical protein
MESYPPLVALVAQSSASLNPYPAESTAVYSSTCIVDGIIDEHDASTLVCVTEAACTTVERKESQDSDVCQMCALGSARSRSHGQPNGFLDWLPSSDACTHPQ